MNAIKATKYNNNQEQVGKRWKAYKFHVTALIAFVVSVTVAEL